MADEFDHQVHFSERDETMIYRKPTDDSDEAAVQDIWGTRLETRVVDGATVSGFVADGWVCNPLDLGVGAPPTSEALAPSLETVIDNPTKAARDAAEKLAQHLGEKVKTLTAERDAANERAGALENDLSAEKALRLASSEHIKTLEAQLAELKKGGRKP
jgi:vacuolar-type H+-ATPase subunit I/STV1